MALNSSLISDRQREMVPNKMQYQVGAAALLGTSKIMQYKSPDFGDRFSGETGNNVIRFTINGPGLLDPRSVYLQYAMTNNTASSNFLGNCDPGSYSPFKRIRLLSGFNQQVLYDIDGYNVYCAFMDDYTKNIHDLVMDGTGFYSIKDSPGAISGATQNYVLPTQSEGLGLDSGITVRNDSSSGTTQIDAGCAVKSNQPYFDGEYLQWQFKPQLGGIKTSSSGLGLAQNLDKFWFPNQKLFTICDLPYIGMLTQGKYIPLWALGGLIMEVYLDSAASWCNAYAANAAADGTSTAFVSGTTTTATVAGYYFHNTTLSSAVVASPSVELSDVKLFYDNVVPPADFLESLKAEVNSPEGLSLLFPSVNRHLATLPAVFPSSGIPGYSTLSRSEVLIADHSRMAQGVFQIFRPQNLISVNGRPYKLHNRTSAAIANWQLKLNSSYIPQQPLNAVGNLNASSVSNAPSVMPCDGVNTWISTSADAIASNYALLTCRQYGQFHRELIKAMGQQSKPRGSVTPTNYEVQTDCDGSSANANHKKAVQFATRGAFAVGVDLTVSDDIISGTNLRNATVTGEMFANIDRYVHPAATLTEVQTFVVKLSQIRMTAAGPIIVD